jgi:hypothetical protein
VEGFDWCSEPKRVGVEALTRKTLCARHNSKLSVADEAIDLFNKVANALVPRASVPGRSLERWFLKTLVNLSIGTRDHIGVGMAESEPGWPSPYLAEVACGSLSLSHSMGLYLLSCSEPYKFRQGEILFVPLIRDYLTGGAVFGIAGLYFFLSLNPGVVPTTIGEMAPNSTLPDYIKSARMIYRPMWLEFAAKNGSVTRIDIDWYTA